MKQFLITIAFLGISFVGFGQCPTEPISFTSQAEVDNFVLNYPNCTELTHDISVLFDNINNLQGLSSIESSTAMVEVYNTEITSLDGLHNLRSVNKLVIQENDFLENFEALNLLEHINFELVLSGNLLIENLEGFGNLQTLNRLRLAGAALVNFEGINPSLTVIGDESQTISGINIYNCNFLESFSGLENLVLINGNFSIQDTSNLENFNGLSNLEEIRGQLSILVNDSLENFVGLNSLGSVDGLSLLANYSLESLTGLENLHTVNGLMDFRVNILLTSLSPLSNIVNSNFSEVVIQSNEALQICDINAVCEHLDIPDSITTIENNSTGCNSISEVEIECGIVDIPDTNFLDALVNHNPIIDTNNDDLIQFDEAEAFTGTINVANKVISDFTGLEAFVNITGFTGSGNFMSTLSLKDNTAITSVDFSDSPDLEAVNLKNGNNTAITSFEGALCPSLQFICVDDVAFAEANFTNVDAQVQFVDDCEFLAIPDFNLENAVVVFPNPVSETLNISVQKHFNYIKTEIYSVSGQKLKETTSAEINMIDLSAGIYFVKVYANKGAVTKKIVKQ